MSHDTDKLIRQLSLVAFLMAERRPLTARDVKQNVEGYQEMSDEAFARRFYSDRAELIALGVPLDSQRDEFTGEELYRLSSERYFLPPLELTDEELAALQTCLYLLEGQFAYAEPLRLALQNLALGRPGLDEAPTETARAVELHDPGYSPELPGRLAKLEGAISKNRTLKFEYWSIMRQEQRERTVNAYALLFDRGQWYVIGLDLDDERIKTFRVSRIRGEIRLATRRERDFRLAEGFDAEAYRQGPPWQVGGRRARPRSRSPATRPGGSTACSAATDGSRTASSSRTTPTSGSSPPGSCARTAGRCRSRPRSSGAQVRADLDLVHKRHAEKPPKIAAEAAEAVADEERAAREPRSAGALRAPAGPARVPARPLRRRHARRDPGLGHQRALQHPARVDRGASPAPEPRQLRRRLLRGLHRAPRRPGPRREGALRRHVPLAAAADAARGARDPARARVRRPDDRRRRAHAARARAPEARGDLRRVRPRPGGGAPVGTG